MSQGCNGGVCDSRAWLPRDSVLPRLVRCLRGFLDEQPCCRLLIIVKCCVTDHAKYSRFGCFECSQVCRSRDVSRSPKPDS